MLSIHRIKDVKTKGLLVIEIDGGCLAHKWCRLSEEGLNLEPLPVPQQPITGWELLIRKKFISSAQWQLKCPKFPMEPCTSIYPVDV